MKTPLPAEMTAVFTDPGSGKLLTRHVEVPLPGKGEVLVRMIAAPVNPSDLAKIREISAEDAPGFIPGIEGCGTVVAAGKGILPAIFLGKRVACSAKYNSSGTWADYMVTSAAGCFPVSKGIPDLQAAMTLVNPMTALAFLDFARKHKHEAVVMTAAAGALGKMASALFARQRIKVLNIVRSQEGKKELQLLGNKHILSSPDPEFHKKFQEWCREMNATLMLDAVGGELVNPLLGLMPAGSTILLYGNLSNQKVEFMAPQLVRENKQIIGFFLGHWIHEQGMIKTIINLRKINRMLKKGMETHVQAVFTLDEAQKAVELYEGNMGKGKVLLVPGP